MEAEAKKNETEVQSEFPKAEQAKENAAKAFRKRLTMILNEAIETGVNRIDLDVTGVDDAAVRSAQTDLEALGYSVSSGRVAKIQTGKTISQLTIKY